MSSVIHFTPISGCHSDMAPLCYLLEIDDYQLLLDCGWNERFDVADLASLKTVIDSGKLRGILISHPDIFHLGALPYVVSKFGLKVPIYATLPIFKMGQMFLYSAIHNRKLSEDFNVFDLDDIDGTFDSNLIVELKYQQKYKIHGTDLILTPFSAGHIVGSTIWKIATAEGDEVVYAVDYNHKKERHLNGMTDSVLEAISRPSILITDYRDTPPAKYRDSTLLDLVLSTIRQSGNVLLPVDTAGRVLELLVILDACWTQHKLQKSYNLVFLDSQSEITIEFARSQLEWMSDAMNTGFYLKRENPFNFRHVQLIQSIEQLDPLLQLPTVVLATPHTLECGFGRELFIRWSGRPENLIVFTQTSEKESLARYFITNHFPKTTIPLLWKHKAPLQGEELAQWERQQRTKREIEFRAKREEERRKQIVQIRDEEIDDTEMEDVSGRAKHSASHPRLFLPANIRYRSAHLMFPCIEHQPGSNQIISHGGQQPEKQLLQQNTGYFGAQNRFDEYGQVIDVEEMVRRIQEAQFSAFGGTHLNEDGTASALRAKEEEEVAIQERPTKYIVEEIQVQVRCNMQYIDFEGRSDGRSIKNILSKINPRKMIIVNSTHEATEAIIKHCEEKKCADQVLAPKVGESVDVTIETNIFRAKIRDDLFNQLQLLESGSCEVAYVIGEYQFDAQQTQQNSAHQKRMPTICPLTVQGNKPLNLPTVYLGDVKLSVFREVLQKAGFKTEFLKGSLVVNSCLVVTRTSKGHIEIEGPLGEDYFRVRNLLNSQYQVLN